ncbi:prepilin-type N-terminal cleavage/methylation domain-containing protein [Bacillus sp. FJAT-49705]|uniref:Prepilin-type N-terminal cleavage/methylation domain-containing protein n=1 Tax=Cytobacillus citreus TaxID=2833586 RepID=A0ABS5NUG5_9BACI|nr:prepilin-type N-terminal cleavage/methylation domain-containing protein [Cytobacillus citreus]MBS4191471.1 prepilin-type N-terminal cleavage/methylation domain-containing protein [Cytobacillus citreus]
MLKKIGQRLKDQRGLTLVELLAVVVILGIIAAIAVPAIGNIIENSKKDAHIANALQLQNASKLYFVENPSATSPVTLDDLIKAGFVETIQDPSDTKEIYDKSATTVAVSENTTTKEKEYKVTIKGKSTTYIKGSKKASELQRSDVELK